MAPPAPMESVEAVRRRARHRLLGAVVLVLAGVAGFPVLFDTQPRPVAVDIPIEIPDRNKVAPLPPPPGAVSGKVTPAAPASVAKAPDKPAPVAAPAASAAPKVAEKPAAAPEPKPEPKVEPKVAAKAETAKPKPRAGDDGEKARALLEGKPPEGAEAAARFVVQVGAFADADKAREARQKLEGAGLKTYTHVADTKDGKRTRVRAGPYASRAEADKAAEKIKGLDLPAAVLTL